MPLPAITSDRIALPHGIALHTLQCGPRDGRRIVLLHGFPEGAFVWESLMQQLALPENGGYFCNAPYLRGYGASSAPTDVAAYRPKHLVADIAALIDLLGAPLHALVAHDWGGAVAWNVATQHPERIQRLAILNAPHPATLLRELQTNPQQQAASAYMNRLADPGAESWLAADGFAKLWKLFLAGAMHTDWLTPERRQRYIDTWSAGLTGACNYYRASPLKPSAPGADVQAVQLPTGLGHVTIPTLVMWAMQDPALRPELTDGLDAYVPQLHVERHPQASHWVLHEDPAWVQRQLLSFL
jgi:epoxide hydrolase 4